ncbi:LPP20 family lipoprotein [Nitrospina watsonii]|uniref:Lipoprotein LPP20-like domain-containing protein n=1 Tax=Nitrospina watsonii TaxID=1323948 RepID=A0ABM9HA38_9BACT|nr:LPP20 family lipoprotein [Nitrospina watsonii]CAI2716975.1 conserved exported protein of unknown function [Nitrospina watsonii]
MKTLSRWNFGLLIVLAAFLSACSSTPEKPSGGFVPIQDLDAPEWVLKGQGAFDDRAFYGVGSAVGIRNTSLLRTSSENRARAALADVFETYVKKLYKDYQESATTGDMSATSETQYVEQALKNITNMSLRGSTIVDHWQNPNNGEMFSLAKIDLEHFEKNLSQYNDLSKQIRDQIKDQAEKSFDELDAEIDKMEGR